MKKNMIFTLIALFSSALLAEDNCPCCDDSKQSVAQQKVVVQEKSKPQTIKQKFRKDYRDCKHGMTYNTQGREFASVELMMESIRNLSEAELETTNTQFFLHLDTKIQYDECSEKISCYERFQEYNFDGRTFIPKHYDKYSDEFHARLTEIPLSYAEYCAMLQKKMQEKKSRIKK